MWVSLNEIEQTASKGARGAGYGWGLAEEAGAAARWLAMRGLPFLQPLTMGVLKQMQRLESFDSARRIGSSHRPVETANRLGPISVLTALSDELLLLPPLTGELSIRALAAPVLVLPALARISKRYDKPLLVRWPGVAIDCRAGTLTVDDAGRAGLQAVLADWFTVTRLTAAPIANQAVPNLRHQGADVNENQWRELTAFACRMYIPEAETSRLGGAGTGRTDND